MLSDQQIMIVIKEYDQRAVGVAAAGPATVGVAKAS